VPPTDTVIEVDVAPLLHNNEPVKSEAVNTELPQLSVTVIVGVATTEFTGAAVALPGVLVQPFTD
jgi:energy-converting hydrogenase Eha subunit G